MNSQKLEAQVKAKLQASIDKLEKTAVHLKDYSWLSAVRAHIYLIIWTLTSWRRCNPL